MARVERPAPERVIIRADGAARGNPGPAAAGAVIVDASSPGASRPDASPLAVISRPLGIQTNNYAEYTAVVLALERAAGLGAQDVELVLDSKLVVEQLLGRWKVRHAGLAPLHGRAVALLRGFRHWTARHEPRAANAAADALANLALDDPRAAAAAEAGSAAATPTTATAPGLSSRSSAGGAEEPVGRATVGAACAIFDDDGRVLLVRHSYGRRNWELPGGAAHPNEAPDAAASRELEEETGLVGVSPELAGVYFEPDEERLGPIVHFLFRMTATGTASARPPEILDARFWPAGDLPRPISDFTARRVEDARHPGVAFGLVERRRWL